MTPGPRPTCRDVCGEPHGFCEGGITVTCQDADRVIKFPTRIVGGSIPMTSGVGRAPDRDTE
jgi:hypothetical protein